MFNRAPALLLILASSLCAQTPLVNNGKPMLVAYDCNAEDIQSAGLGCSDDDPCPVYIELANVEAVGTRVFVTGNFHTAMATLASILLASEDGGNTWTEPHPREHSSGLDQIQFVDFQNGWISGANLQTAPRDPFLLITNDGGKTWRDRPIFDETRVAAIERFSFDSSQHGTLLIDARLDNGMHEMYETKDGGDNWTLQQTAAHPAGEKEKRPANSGWRLRTEAATHSYVVEKSENNRWQRVASFLVHVATCKE